MLRWVHQILIALDQLVNAILGGWADETLSSRAWRTEAKGRGFGRVARPVIDTLLFFDPQHCYASFLSEKFRRQMPPECRGDVGSKPEAEVEGPVGR